MIFLVLSCKSELIFLMKEQGQNIILVGVFAADIVVEELLILELKSVKGILKVHEMQLVNYLTSTGKPVGLIINFGELKVEIKKKLRI